MSGVSIIFSMFLIFAGAALLSTLALYTRQSLLVAYIALGMLLGPSGFKLVTDADMIRQVGEVGIIFLLFLLGLNLHPQNLWRTLKEVSWVALTSCLLFSIVGYSVGWLFGFSVVDSLVIGAAMMFSSTIIALKLLPTTILHHQHTGEMIISILLLQDIVAIVILLLLHGAGNNGLSWQEVGLVVLGLPGLIAFAFFLERFVLVKLFAKFDQIQEYIFLLSIAWCLGFAELSQFIGLSEEIGAFIAGVAIASSPIALFISESLKPLRDFFLVMFFFSIGAHFNVYSLKELYIPVLVLTTFMLIVKPLVFRYLLGRAHESRHMAWEIGARLGQVSEFSLLIAYLSTSMALITPRASYLIQATTILSFVISSYWVVLKYPTPLAFSDKMRRD